MATILWENYSVFNRIEFDATLSEHYNSPADVTEHPVEEGAPISDNIRQKPNRVTVVGTISETPIEVADLFTVGNVPGGPTPYRLDTKYFRMLQTARVHGGLRSPIDPPGFTTPQSTIRVDKAVTGEGVFSTGGSRLEFTSNVDRVAEVFDILLRLQAEGVEVQLVGSLRTYDKMVIANVVAPKGPEGSVDFTIELVEFRTAETQEEELVRTRRPEQKRSEDKTPATVTAPVALDPFEEEELQKQSVLSSGLDSLVRQFE